MARSSSIASPLALRIAAAVAVGATLAYGVTLVAKRTSAAMFIFFLQFPLLSLLDPAKMPFGLISHYAPLRGLLAVVIDPTTATNTQERAIHTMAGGVVLTAVWIVGVAAGSGFVFSKSRSALNPAGAGTVGADGRTRRRRRGGRRVPPEPRPRSLPTGAA